MRWEMGLNKRSVATFRFKEAAAEDLRLNAGEELLLKLDAPTASLYGQEWQAQGVILRLFDGEVRVLLYELAYKLVVLRTCVRGE